MSWLPHVACFPPLRYNSASMAAADPPAAAPRLPFPLQEQERVLALIRRHWWFLWPQTIILALIAVVPVIVVALLLSSIAVLDDLGIFFWIAGAVWLLYLSVP